MQNTKLNILIYPMFSVDNMNADSNYIIIKQLCNELIKTDNYNFFLILDSNRKYYQDDIDKNIKIIKMPFPRGKKHQVIHFNTNIIREIFKKYAIDIVWNNVVERGHHFKYFQDTLLEKSRMKVFNYHHYVIHRSLEHLTSYLPCRHIMLDQIIGSMTVDINYFHTQHCYNMLMEEAEDILNKKQLQLLKDTCKVEIGGYCNRIETDEKYHMYTFIYNHRLDGYKNWKNTFEMFDRLYEKYTFKVIVTAGDKGNLGAIENKPYVEIKSFSLHSDYLKELSKCHANVINSRHETFCISVAESIMNDQLVIAPNKVTFPELVDKNYPYLFNNEEEQYEIIAKLLQDNIREYKYKESNKLLLETHATKIDKLFMSLRQEDDYGDVFNKIKKQTTKVKIQEYVAKHSVIDLTEFKNYIFRLGYASQSFPMTKIKRILNELGYTYNINMDKYCRNGTK